MVTRARHIHSGFGPALVLALAAALGCEGQGPSILDAEDDGTPGGVERPSLNLHVTIEPDDATLASALGWSAGVPAANVRILRLETNRWIEGVTDEKGQITFDNLLSGYYRVIASRVLDSGEASAAGMDVRAFGDGQFVRVSGTTDADLKLQPDQPGTLVFSEISNMSVYPWERSGASLGGFWFEIYNNSETTIYLDGMVFGMAYGGARAGVVTCAMSEPIRTADGIYSRFTLAFPGNGSDYPIEPGVSVLLAEGAVDHRHVHPNLPDLREADFEIVAAAAADNPQVPNMVDIGMGAVESPTMGGRQVFFIAEPTEVSTLPRITAPVSGWEYALFPAASIIDAVGVWWTDPEWDSGVCGGMVQRQFERHEFPGLINDGDPRNTAQRRVLRSEAGRSILQNTNTSAVDFLRGVRTPGGLQR